MIKTYKANTGKIFEWDTDTGIGHLEVTSPEQVYDIEYWNRYLSMKDSDIGKKLTQARINLCKKYNVQEHNCVDIGIGNGDFVDKFGCFGTDINPHAVKYLKDKGKYTLVDDDWGWNWFTLWDVWEHLPKDFMQHIVNNNHVGIIMSTPIYDSFEHCISSKHFRPDEHEWYFTTSGLIKFMEDFGYRCLEVSSVESDIGREDIKSFVFKKL